MIGEALIHAGLKEWTLNGDTYEGLLWHNQDVPKPTKKQVDGLVKDYKAHLSKKEKNDAIIARLHELDLKSIRALREGNQERIAQLEAEAEELRKEILP